MNNQELQLHLHNKIGLMDINFDHSIVKENDMKDNELYYITKIIGNYELVEITSEYDHKFNVNPKYIKDTEKTWAGWSKKGDWI